MPTSSSDPFELDGKNLRRVIPPLRRSIRIQRDRMIGAVVALVFLAGMAFIGLRGHGVLKVFGIGCLVTSPFTVVSFFAERHVRNRLLAKLEECHRRLSANGGVTTSRE